MELWSQVNRPESTGAEKQFLWPCHSQPWAGFSESQMAGFLGVIFDFYGFVRFGKKINAGQGWTLLAVAGTNAHSAVAEFPGRLDIVGSFSLQRSEEKSA